MRNRFVFALIVAGVVALGSQISLAARSGGPTIFRDVIDDTFVFRSCGFPIEVRTTGTGVFHIFRDAEGNLERVLITSAAIRFNFTNLLTGESVWTPSVNMVREDFDDDGSTQTLRGLLWHLVVPGEGLITADVGRIDFRFTVDEEGNVIAQEVVFLAGQQDNQFIPQLCSVLGS